MAPRPRPKYTSSVVRTNNSGSRVSPALPDGKGAEAIKIELHGANNQLPQELVRKVYNSGTATLCVNRLGLFVGGKGFADESVATRMANPEQTYNQLWAEIANYCGWQLGVAYIIRYPFGGNIEDAEIWAGAVDCLRVEKGGGGRYVINYKLNEGKMPAGENRVYLPYNPKSTPEEIAEEVIAAAASDAGYWGHIYFNFKYELAREIYPIPNWASGIEDIEADGELPKYELKQIKSSFTPDAIFTLPGLRYADIPDEDWTPGEGEDESHRPYFPSPDREDFEANIKAMQGASSGSSVLVQVVENEEEKPQIDWIGKGPNAKGLTDMTNRLEGKVYRRFGVPPVLCGVAQPGTLGDNQQIVASIKLFGLTVEPARAVGIDPLKKLFPTVDFSIIPLNPVEYIDPLVAAKMTEDEIRAIQGLPALKKPQASKAQETLQILSTASPLVATQLLKDLTQDERRELMNREPLAEVAPAAAPRPKPRPKQAA